MASHIKPWRDCDNHERLSGANGLLLSPHVDKLFDRHWISFDSGGEMICEHDAAPEALRCWGITGANLIRPFSREQKSYLAAHREVLRRWAVICSYSVQIKPFERRRLDVVVKDRINLVDHIGVDL